MTAVSANPFAGIYPALITPFTADGDVDVRALRTYVRHLVVSDEVDGLFVCGSYGSSPLMTPGQRVQVAETVAEEAGGKLKLLLHVGAPDLGTTLELTRHAGTIGVDAVAAVTPYYYRHLEADVEAAYLDLIDAAERPVFLYNNPKYTNFETPPGLLARLADAGLAGVKDSSGDIATFEAFIQAVDRADFAFLVGSQTLLLPALERGGHGCISGLSNAFPGLIKSVYRAFQDGDPAEAGRRQELANQLRQLTGAGIPVPFYHSVLPMLGVDIGVPRRPFRSLDEGRVAEIKTALADLDLLPAAGTGQP